MNVTGTDSVNSALNHTAVEQLTVAADFSIALSPTSVSVAAGQSSPSIGVTITRSVGSVELSPLRVRGYLQGLLVLSVRLPSRLDLGPALQPL